MRGLNWLIAGLLLAGRASQAHLSAADDLKSPTVDVTVVDEADKPVAGATVRVQEAGGAELFVSTAEVALSSDANGVVRITPPFAPARFQVTLLASDAAGDRQGYLAWRLRSADEANKPLRIVLKPPREVAVRVVDMAGDPIAGATVGILHQTMQTLTHGRTNADGTIRLRFPANAPIYSAFALKSAEGFDQWSRRADQRSVDPRELPPTLSFTLNGAQTARVRAVDSAGKPVAGVSIFAPLLGGASQSSPPTSLIQCRLGDAITDENGVATIDWLPEGTKRFSFLVRSDRYALLDRRNALLELFNGKRDVTVELSRLTKISGKVTRPNGKPAAGIVVLAQGTNGSTQDFHAAARTAADGTYSVPLEAGKVYALSIADENWAAASRMGVHITEDQPVAGFDFDLIEGTIIRGNVAAEQDPTATSQQLVRLTEIGGQATLPGVTRPLQINVLRSSPPDAQGNYRFRVGPGRYELQTDRGPFAPRPISVKVSTETEIVRDLGRQPGARTEAPKTASLSGKVVGPDGKPVAGVAIRANYATVEFTPFRETQIATTSQADGTFRFDRQLTPMWLFASSPDGALVGRVSIDDEQRSVAVELAPAGQAVGRLIDGDVPLAGLHLSVFATVAITGPMGRPARQQVLVAAITTDSNGRFFIPGLTVGESFLVGVDDRPNGLRETPTASPLIRMFPALAVKKPGTLDFGFVDLPAMRTGIADGLRWRYVDIALRAAKRFEAQARLADRISEAAADARREQRVTMLVLGDPLAEGTRSLLKLLDGIDGDDDPVVVRKKREAQLGRGPGFVDDSKRPLADFRRVHIDIKDESAVAHLAEAYRIDVAKIGLPALVILNEEGRVAALRWFTPVGDPPKPDVEALRDFVKQHMLPVRDAKELFDAALRRARNENKRVLVLQTGTDSYPSRLLSRFLAAQANLLDRDFVLLEIDTLRMAKSTEVIPLFRETTGTLPWLGILESDGKKLADSDSPDGNIGFPAEPESINWLIDRMLTSTARNLTRADLETLRSALGRK